MTLNAVTIHIALRTISSRTVRVQVDTQEMATIAQVHLLHHSMRNGYETRQSLLFFVFVRFFVLLGVHKHNSCLLLSEELTNINVIPFPYHAHIIPTP